METTSAYYNLITLNITCSTEWDPYLLIRDQNATSIITAFLSVISTFTVLANCIIIIAISRAYFCCLSSPVPPKSSRWSAPNRIKRWRSYVIKREDTTGGGHQSLMPESSVKTRLVGVTNHWCQNQAWRHDWWGSPITDARDGRMWSSVKTRLVGVTNHWCQRFPQHLAQSQPFSALNQNPNYRQVVRSRSYIYFKTSILVWAMADYLQLWKENQTVMPHWKILRLPSDQWILSPTCQLQQSYLL